MAVSWPMRLLLASLAVVVLVAAYPASYDSDDDDEELNLDLLTRLLAGGAQEGREEYSDEQYYEDTPPPGHVVIPDWPLYDGKLGEIGGVATDADDNLALIHRGPHQWTPETFDEGNNYALSKAEPIKEAAVVVLTGEEGKEKKSWGEGLFYMPHGLTIDSEGFYWITDVALHQVFKFAAGEKAPLLTLGERFTPGSDDDHFCKPTDVAVASSGEFFVSDGYCNGRIMKFSKDGQLIAQWGKKSNNTDGTQAAEDELDVPHSLALIDEDDVICVADRENSRIQCYKAGLKESNETGEFVQSIANNEIGRVYAIEYSGVDRENPVLYAVTEAEPGSDGPNMGFTISLPWGEIVDTWAPAQNGFSSPHDVTVDQEDAVYVGEISPSRVLKFEKYNIE